MLKNRRPNIFSAFDSHRRRDEGRRRHRSHQNRDVLRTHVGTTFKKSPLADENTLGTGIPCMELGRSKIMWPTDIFPIRFELMYRQYYGDASKTA